MVKKFRLPSRSSYYRNDQSNPEYHTISCRCHQCQSMMNQIAEKYKPDFPAARKSMLSSLLGPEAKQHCDITLISLNGVELPACSTLLSIRSEYFHKLFYSDFKESRGHHFTVSIHESQLEQILEFAYTGNCSFIEELIGKTKSSLDISDIGNIVDLCAAAKYCWLDELYLLCNTAIVDICTLNASLICSFLQSADRYQFDFTSAVTVRDKLIFSKAHTVFNVPTVVPDERGVCFDSTAEPANIGILQLTSNALLFAFNGPTAIYDQEYLFQCVFFWVTHGTLLNKASCHLSASPTSDTAKCNDVEEKSTDNSKSKDCEVLFISRERFKCGKTLASHLNLQEMKMRFVHDYVIPTQLVDNIDMLALLTGYLLSSSDADTESTWPRADNQHYSGY